MRILITGSRDWDLYDSIVHRIVEAVQEWIASHPELQNIPTDWVTIVHGDCPRGADFLADQFARKVTGWEVEKYPADWSLGKSAGYRRNRRMVNTAPDICLAFIRNKSKGSTSCRDLAKAAGIPTETFLYENEIEIYG